MTKSGNGKARWGSAAIDPVLVDPTGQLNQRSILPGYDGVPFRGKVPELRRDDPTRVQPEIHQQVHIDVLDLSVEADMKRYRELCQTIANGFGQLSKEDMQYDTDKKCWRVFVRWLEFFSTTPKGMTNGNPG